MNNKICWITATYMLQVDLPILSTLNKKYFIDWYIWGSSNTDSAELARQYAKDNGINIVFIHSPYSFVFNPLLLRFTNKTIKSLANKNYDAYYFDVSTFPFLLFSIKKYLPFDKVVIAMHHGKIHSGMRFKPIYRPFLKYLNRQPFYLQYFSNIQAEAFNGKNESKRYLIPLALNDFGKANISINNDIVIFTAFGNIIESKNIPLLIEAGNRLWEDYSGRFRIRIAGRGRLWETYKSFIRHSDAFILDIRRIADEEIPNLFSSSHYIMFPYKAVTQSGPLRIAYGYNVPVIASDLDGFKESIENNITGLFFKSENIDSLVNVMRNAIERHPEQYFKIKESQFHYVQRNLSTDSVCAKYIEMFDKVLSK